MQGTSRRHFLRGASAATAGMASWVALGKPPAFAQKRELTFLSWNHFVPASDDELRKKYGGWYPFAREGSHTTSGWKAVPWFWISFPATYNMTHFKSAGLEY